MTAPTRPGPGERPRLPPNQALLPAERWPVVGEARPRTHDGSPWTVTIDGCVRQPLTWPLAVLMARPRIVRVQDVHCVTRWSRFDMAFEGLRLADLLAEGGGPAAGARYVSFQARSDRGHSTSLPLAQVEALDPLVAFAADGAPLPEEHGGPVRMVVPGKYFYKSVKWLERISLLTEDRLGYWEGETGYHNNADPWAEERYIARNLDRRRVKKLMADRSMVGLDLLGLVAVDLDLTGLRATDAKLRNADFRRSRLRGADFSGANLSNARLDTADLRGARFVTADLEGASFAGADLRGADLTGASLFGASFGPEPPDGDRSLPPARMDVTTRLEAGQLDRLSPAQQALVARALERDGIGGDRSGDRA